MTKINGAVLALAIMFMGMFMGGAVAAQVSPLAAKPADLGLYATSGVTLSFVASGVSALDDCKVPLEFREAQRQSVQILEIVCPGANRPRFARLTFVRVKDPSGKVHLSPFRMEFLP